MLAEKKRNYSQTAQLNTIFSSTYQKENQSWKELILPLTIGAGTIGGIAAISYWLNKKNAGKPKISKGSAGPNSNIQLKIKKLLNQHFVNLKKLQKSGYNPELVQEINENFKQIQVLTWQLEKAKKTEFEEQKWNNLQAKYKKYVKNQK